MSVLLTGLLGLFGGSSFLIKFNFEDLSQPLLLAATLGTVASWLVTGLGRRGPVLAALAGVVVVAGAGVLTGSFEASGLRDGPLAIAQAAPPVPADASLLTVPFAAVGLAAFLGAELAQRSRAAASPVLPSLAVLLAGLVLGGAGRDLALSGPFAWTAAALVLVGWRSRPTSVVVGRQPAGGLRKGVSLALAGRAATLIVVAVVLAVGAGAVGHQVLADQDRERFEWEEPKEPDAADGEEAFNPLGRVTTLHDGANDTLFEVETSAPVERWSLAVLATYDGQSWSSDETYDTAGRELPPLPPIAAADPELLAGPPEEVDQVVAPTTEGRRSVGQRLPVVGRPVEVDIDDLLFQTESGALAADGELPDRYGVTSEVVWPDSGALADADVAGDSEARAALELPEDVPEEIADLADELTNGIDSPYGQAVALQGYFDGLELASEEPPSGHSLGHLVHFLSGTGTRRGSPEQFAASYALLARLAELPSRVVVGFNGLGAAGEHTITSHSATAWVEIKFEGVGWVSFDPVPQLATEAAPPEEEEIAGSDEDSPEDLDDEIDDDEDTDDEDLADDANDEDEADAGGGVPLYIVGPLALLGVMVTAPAVRRALRRRRQQRGPNAGERIAGAWEATLDVLHTAGVPVGQDLGAFDVVGVSETDGDREPLWALGALVNSALFAPVSPGDAAAARAWELRDEVARGYRRRRSRRQALRDYFSGR